MIFTKINVIIRKEWVYLPTISMFYGIVIRMYYTDHNPPHIHAYYNDNIASFDFEGTFSQLVTFSK